MWGRDAHCRILVRQMGLGRDLEVDPRWRPIDHWNRLAFNRGGPSPHDGVSVYPLPGAGVKGKGKDKGKDKGKGKDMGKQQGKGQEKGKGKRPRSPDAPSGKGKRRR